jgi:hypothetical protein
VDGLCPEQITAAPTRDATSACLIDQWGRVHHLSDVTTIGRDPEQAMIAVLEQSVSRLHVELRLDRGRWMVRDLGSTNGSFIEGKRVDRATAIGDLQLLVVGDVGFVFVLDGGTIGIGGVPSSIRATVAHARNERLRLIEPAAGGGGVVDYGGAQVQLGATQFALVRLLGERFLAEQGRPDEVRGFVRSVELMKTLPWETAHPDDNHVKQMVRRVRRALARVGLEDAIESRHGFGYRLVIPPIFATE